MIIIYNNNNNNVGNSIGGVGNSVVGPYFVFILSAVVVAMGLELLRRTVKPYLQTVTLSINLSASSPLNEVINQCQEFHVPYTQPLLWGFNGHLQTAYTMFFRRSPAASFLKHVFAVPDDHPVDEPEAKSVLSIGSGVVSIDFFADQDVEDDGIVDPNDRTPVVFVVPGLAGSSKMHYIRNFSLACRRRGWRAVVLNHRGCCDRAELVNHRIFMYGDCRDLHEGLWKVADRWPNAPIMLCGFSMGGNIVANYLGRVPKKHRPPRLLVGASVCQGFDLVKASNAMSPLYSRLLAMKMKQVVRNNRERLDPALRRERDISVDAVLQAQDHVQFDSLYTVPAHSRRDQQDWPSLDHYYRDQSSAPHLATVDVPLLCLNALDDPLVPEHVLPMHETQTNPHLVWATTPTGGHLGFALGDSWLLPDQSNLMDRVIPSFFESVLKSYQQQDNKLK